MSDLVNIKDYYEYLSLNEDLKHGEQNTCNRAFINGGPITFADGSSVRPEDIVKAVGYAIMKLNLEFPTTFEFANECMNIIYLAHSNKIKTMAVDKYMNLYMNAGFIYHTLKMDKDLIAAVLMHETFHALFNHIERSTNWLAAQGRPKNAQTWHDTNLAADVEVNQTLVRSNVISAERLVNEIHGLYLKNKDGVGGIFTDVVPLEIILGNEEYMKKLREMCPPPPNPEEGNNGRIPTTPEWDKGYKEAWNKIAGLVKKYGAQGTWDILLKAGLVNGVGEVYTDHEISDIMGLEFKQVKTMDEFVNEDLKQIPSEKGKTYEDGFITAFGKLCSTIYNSLQPDDEDGIKGGGGGAKYKSDLKDDDLDEINLPGKGKKGKNEEEDDGLPNKIKQQGENDNEDGSEQSGEGGGGGSDKSPSNQKSHGKGGKGKSDDELSEDDLTKIADDLRNKLENGQKKSTSQQMSIGGMGTFEEEGLSDEDLRDAGYGEEDLKAINKIRKDNERNNSKEKIENAIEKVKRDISKHSALGQLLDAIEVESRKYKNIWKEILKEFMAKTTRRAGSDKANGHNDWMRKKSIARGEYGIHHQKTAQDPQDVNVYIDVSGSMDIELIEIICQSLVVFTQQFKYSGINICPWASTSNGIYKVDEFYKKTKDAVTAEILTYVSKGQAQCGGGTNASAVFSAMQDVVIEALNDTKKRRKDDVHVVITDGCFDYDNIESRMKKVIMSAIDREDVAEKAPKHTFWMIYDMPEEQRGKWEKEIKEGKLIFINSEVVKNNG